MPIVTTLDANVSNMADNLDVRIYPAQPFAATVNGPLPKGYCAKVVYFIHPISESTIFFSFAFDETDSEDRRPGVHHGLALTACAIIAYNRKGYFATSPDNPVKIEAGWDTVLVEDKYYFFLEPSDDDLIKGRDTTKLKYPLCPDFQSWNYPGLNSLPVEWKYNTRGYHNLDDYELTNFEGRVVPRLFAQCRLSGWQDGLSIAQILPKHQSSWFADYDMHDFNMGCFLPTYPSQMLDKPCNGLLLRIDLCHHWDELSFVILPKRGTLVSHIMDKKKNLYSLYHNTQLQGDASLISAPFLYSHFAYFVFDLMKNRNYLESAPARRRLKQQAQKRKRVKSGEGKGERQLKQSKSGKVKGER